MYKALECKRKAEAQLLHTWDSFARHQSMKLCIMAKINLAVSPWRESNRLKVSMLYFVRHSRFHSLISVGWKDLQYQEIVSGFCAGQSTFRCASSSCTWFLPVSFQFIHCSFALFCFYISSFIFIVNFVPFHFCVIFLVLSLQKYRCHQINIGLSWTRRIRLVLTPTIPASLEKMLEL